MDNPTLRKVRNRGWEPVRYRDYSGSHNGWIYKRGYKLLHCHFPSLGNVKLPLEEERYMQPLTTGGTQ